jgi:hypothetical protein
MFPEKYVHSKSVQGRIKQKATIGASSRQLKAQKNKNTMHTHESCSSISPSHYAVLLQMKEEQRQMMERLQLLDTKSISTNLPTVLTKKLFSGSL